MPAWVIVALGELVIVWALRRRHHQTMCGIVQMDRYEARRFARRLYRQRLVFWGVLLSALVVCFALWLAWRYPAR